MQEEINKIFKRFTDRKKTGAFLVKPTGKLLEDDKTFIQIEYRGEIRYAKPAMPFGWYFVPTEEWLEKYKDEISIWVMFEQGDPRFPVWFGFAPRNNKIPGDDNFPNTAKMKTVEFEFLLDDTEKQLSLRNFEKTGLLFNENVVSLLHKEDIGIKIDKNKVYLGNVDKNNEPVTLSEQLISVLQDMLDLMAEITVTSPVGNTSVPLNSAQMLAMKEQLEVIKSEVTYTN